MLHTTQTPFIARSAVHNNSGLYCSGLNLEGKTVVALMRANGHTLRGLAQRMGISIARVRQVRAEGIQGLAFAWDWIEALQEAPHQ